jgi:long-chain acyl-CoA synthetase
MGGSPSKQVEYGVWIGEEKPGETRILRHPKVGTGELHSEPIKDLNTIWKTFEYAVNLHGNRPFLGTRKTISKDKFGEYQWKSFKEIDALVKQFATGINVLDLCPEIESHHDGKFKFMGIYARNREEWVVADLACHLNSVTVVTFYDTLGDDTIGFVLEQTLLTSIVMESKNLKKINKIKKENKAGNLQNVILLDVEDEGVIKEAEGLGIKCYTYEQVFELAKGKETTFTPASPDTVATFCYTSGTTGIPKGAMIPHKALLAEIAALPYTDANFKETDVHLSYLPLAHVMERGFITAAMLRCVAVGFFTGNAQKLIEDAQVLKPTIFLGVPRIYQRVYEVINTNMKKQGFLKRSLAEKAVKTKLENYHTNGSLTHSIWDKLVFNKTKNALGGKVRVMITGSAPISPEILSFLKICFCCPILEGYGQTENCAAATLTAAGDFSSGHVGGPVVSCELKLVDVPELNYLSSDKTENGVSLPRGEICVRGPIVFKGYFNDKENTDKAFDKDGWLKTGDIGCILPNGNSLKILDRVKNIFKLSHGEYVAPEKLENVLMQSSYVNQIMIHGDSLENFVVAILIPKKDACVEYFHKQGKQDVTLTNVHEYFGDEGLKSDILKDLEVLGRSRDFKGFEVIKKVHLIDEPFSLENGLMTPTMKVKRHEVKNKYLAEIKQMYGQK